MNWVWSDIRQEKSIGQIMWRNDTESKWNWCMFDSQNELMMIAIWWCLQCNQIHEFFFGVCTSITIFTRFYRIKSLVDCPNRINLPFREKNVEFKEWKNSRVVVVHVISIFSPHFSLKLELVHWICLFYQLFDVF